MYIFSIRSDQGFVKHIIGFDEMIGCNRYGRLFDQIEISAASHLEKQVSAANFFSSAICLVLLESLFLTLLDCLLLPF